MGVMLVPHSLATLGNDFPKQNKPRATAIVPRQTHGHAEARSLKFGRLSFIRSQLRRRRRMYMYVLTRMTPQHIQRLRFSFNVARPHP